MKLWIRVDSDVARDPAVHDFAAAIGEPLPMAIGHLILLWGTMAEHAPSGDLGRVSVSTLEHWAAWMPKRGRARGTFATAFREHFCGSDGVVRGWKDRQGKLIERADKDRARKLRNHSTEVPRNIHGNSAVTERNGTEQREKTPPRARRDSTFRPPPGAPPKADFDSLYSRWVGTHGATAYPRFRTALKPLFPASGALYPPATVDAAIVVHAEWVNTLSPEKAKWETVERFAGDVVRWVKLAEQPLVLPDGTPSERARMLLGAA